MAKKVSHVIQLARDSVNDPLSARFDATEALRFYNRTLNTLFNDRPDIFVGNLTTAPADKSLNDNVPYDDEHCQLHADLLAAEFDLVPDEESNTARAGILDKRARS